MASIDGLRDATNERPAVFASARRWMVFPAIVAVALVWTASPARASLLINPTFGASITNDPNAAVIEGAINAGIAAIEGDITSPNALTVTILFNTMNSGLGQSSTSVYGVSYQDYYNTLKAVATSPAQLTALASLGPPPTGPASNNPVTGTPNMAITSAEGRNLGFNTPGGVSGTFDSEITLNTSITSPPNPLGGNYGLEAVATHEMDEVLGIGGPGSTLASGLPPGFAGDLDLYRWSCTVAIVNNTCSAPTRSYTTSSTAVSYFSIDGGETILSYFNQASGADYSDWLSDPIPAGFSPQVQDAFATPGTNPQLGPNELAALSAIGYEIVSPEASTLPLAGLGLAFGFFFVRRRRTAA
jgi:hypothetical protein